MIDIHVAIQYGLSLDYYICMLSIATVILIFLNILTRCRMGPQPVKATCMHVYIALIKQSHASLIITSGEGGQPSQSNSNCLKEFLNLSMSQIIIKF